MIIKASQRGGGRALARHLLNMADNDFVEVHSLKGFTAQNVTGAFLEIEAISRGTRCVQPFFSVSLSPPRQAQVMAADFEATIDDVAARLGLAGQPRVVLFHEKEGRRHCHVVFSRIGDDMRAVSLPFFKEKLTALSREQYLAHGWELPAGLADRSLRNPTNFSLEEWQTAKRAERDPREIKALFQQCWKRADGAQAFAAALQHHGFWLCRGDKRGFVAVDYLGTVYSLSRWLDVRPKELKARLGEPDKLPGLGEATTQITSAMGDMRRRLLDTVRRDKAEAIAPLMAARRDIVNRQRTERAALTEKCRLEQDDAVRANASLRRRGLAGIFDWVSGRRARLRRQLEQTLDNLRQRHEAAMAALRQQQLAARRPVQESLQKTRAHFAGLHAEIARAQPSSKPRQNAGPSRQDRTRSKDAEFDWER